MKVENRGSIVLVFRVGLMAQVLRLHELSSCGAFEQLMEASGRIGDAQLHKLVSIAKI